MGTKNNPGLFDCYAKAESDEPMFTLLARDPTAPAMVSIWAAVQRGDRSEAIRLVERAFLARDEALAIGSLTDLSREIDKNAEAHRCALAMVTWKLARDGAKVTEVHPEFHVMVLDDHGPHAGTVAPEGLHNLLADIFGEQPLPTAVSEPVLPKTNAPVETCHQCGMAYRGLRCTDCS